jgi:hypothetical protein
MSNFKQDVMYFIVLKVHVIYHPFISPYPALNKNTGKNNTTNDKFVVKATYIGSTDLCCSILKCLSLHFILNLLDFRPVLDEGQFQEILEMFICHVGTLFPL